MGEFKTGESVSYICREKIRLGQFKAVYIIKFDSITSLDNFTSLSVKAKVMCVCI